MLNIMKDFTYPSQMGSLNDFITVHERQIVSLSYSQQIFTANLLL